MAQTTKIIRGMKVEQRPAARSTAEIIDRSEESLSRTNEAIATAEREIAKMARNRATTTTAAPGAAGASFDQLARQYAEAHQVSSSDRDRSVRSAAAEAASGTRDHQSAGVTRMCMFRVM